MKPGDRVRTIENGWVGTVRGIWNGIATIRFDGEETDGAAAVSGLEVVLSVVNHERLNKLIHKHFPEVKMETGADDPYVALRVLRVLHGEGWRLSIDDVRGQLNLTRWPEGQRDPSVKAAKWDGDPDTLFVAMCAAAVKVRGVRIKA